MITILLIIFSSIFVFGPLAKAIADRISRDAPPEAIGSQRELARLRDEVDRLTTEVARLQDEQSFMVKLLNDGERKKLGDTRQNVE